MLSITAQLVDFREMVVFFTGHIVIVSFVFIHIPGGSFIFNISSRHRPVSDLESHIRKPPKAGALRESTIANRKSTISRRLQSSILGMSSILVSWEARAPGLAKGAPATAPPISRLLALSPNPSSQHLQ
jgi:hypothetical protein